jgi:hypothetical protein
MAEWSEDHVAAIGSLKLNFGIFLINYGQIGDQVGPLGGKWRPLVAKIGVICGKPAPPRL